MWPVSTHDSDFRRACREALHFLAALGFTETEYKKEWGELLVMSSPRAFVRLYMEWQREPHFMTTLGPLYQGKAPPSPVFGTEPLLHATLSEVMELRGDDDPSRVQRGPNSRGEDIAERVRENAQALEQWAQPEINGDFTSFAEIEDRRRARSPPHPGPIELRTAEGWAMTPPKDSTKVRVFSPAGDRWDVLSLLSALAYVHISEAEEGVFDATVTPFCIDVAPDPDAGKLDERERVQVRFGVSAPFSGFVVQRDESEEDVTQALRAAAERLDAPVVAVWANSKAAE